VPDDVIQLIGSTEQWLDDLMLTTAPIRVGTDTGSVPLPTRIFDITWWFDQIREVSGPRMTNSSSRSWTTAGGQQSWP
jgi:hypothetical protein